jgi:hypothetical protein
MEGGRRRRRKRGLGRGLRMVVNFCANCN